jgi:hypothetical protein
VIELVREEAHQPIAQLAASEVLGDRDHQRGGRGRARQLGESGALGGTLEHEEEARRGLSAEERQLGWDEEVHQLTGEVEPLGASARGHERDGGARELELTSLPGSKCEVVVLEGGSGRRQQCSVRVARPRGGHLPALGQVERDARVELQAHREREEAGGVEQAVVRGEEGPLVGVSELRDFWASAQLAGDAPAET